MKPRALLVCLRDAHDPMAAHEHRCFARAARLDADDLAVHRLMDGPVPGRALYRAAAVFVGGSGAYSVLDDLDWIHRGMEIMVELAARQRPTWASCFGFQAIAQALGGSVERDPSRAEMGATLLQCTPAARQDPLFCTLPEQFWAQEGHQDHVLELPPGTTLLAAGSKIRCQALRVDGAPVWASQFHPELTPELTLARFQHYRDRYLDPAEAGPTFERLRAATHQTPAVGELLARLVRGQID